MVFKKGKLIIETEFLFERPDPTLTEPDVELDALKEELTDRRNPDKLGNKLITDVKSFFDSINTRYKFQSLDPDDPFCHVIEDPDEPPGP